MSGPRIELDRVKCTSLGLCEAAAPDVFEIVEDGTLAVHLERVPADQLADVRAAVEACPTAALKLVDEP